MSNLTKYLIATGSVTCSKKCKESMIQKFIRFITNL